MADAPGWQQAAGLPTRHVARAALHVASIVDNEGSTAHTAQESYWHHATGGSFAPADLARGEQLLVDLGLLIRRQDLLVPTEHLSDLLTGSVDDALVVISERSLGTRSPLADHGAERHDGQMPPFANASSAELEALSDLVPDPARREELLVALGRRFDDAARKLVGAIGERLVVSTARSELVALGRHDLARQVRQVSLISDQLGYDVTAPRLQGEPRLLEVKSTTRDTAASVVSLYISRNEAMTGAAIGDWALVVCGIDDTHQERGSILGSCAGAAIADLLPVDSEHGRWEQAAIDLPVERLRPGLPSLVA